MIYDVIILGAGPAALFSALYLYKQDIKNICIINKYTKDYHKCCSGFFTEKAVEIMKELELYPEDINYKKISSMEIYYNYKKVFETRDNRKYLYYSPSANRIDFDNLLYEKIKEKNIEYKEKVDVKKILFKDKKIITANNEEINYKYIILADGAIGISSKYNKNINKKMIGLEARIINIGSKKVKGEFNFGITKKGYAWVYQNENYTTIGFTDRYNKKINYTELLKEYAGKKNIMIQNNDIRGAFIPYATRKLMYDSNSFFIGDAAGLVDSLTQEGIYYALLSAKYAVQAIKDNNPKEYKKKMKYSIRILNESRIFAKTFYINILQKIIWETKQKQRDFREFLLSKYIENNNFRYSKWIKYYFEYKRIDNNEKTKG